MFKKENVKGFIAGVCVTAVVSGALAVFASQPTNITASMGGIKCFWDGVQMDMRDAKGTVVEPIRLKGTTYVPIRAIGVQMGKTVDWDPKTEEVYIGTKPIAETLSLKDMDKKKTNSRSISYLYNAGTFTLKTDEYSYNNSLYLGGNSYGEIIYALDGQFSKLEAKAVMPYTAVGSNASGSIEFYGISDSGADEVLLDKIDLQQTEDIRNVSINLAGEENLKIVMRNGSQKSIHLYNVSFVGAGY